MPIGAWLNMYHDAAKDHHAHINDPPDSPYFSEDLLDAGEQCFDEAERLADDEAVLQRVRIARLPLRYVRLGRMNPDDPGRNLLADQLAADLKRYAITEVWERKPLDVSFTYIKNNWMDRRREIPRWDYYM